MSILGGKIAHLLREPLLESLCNGFEDRLWEKFDDHFFENRNDDLGFSLGQNFGHYLCDKTPADGW